MYSDNDSCDYYLNLCWELADASDDPKIKGEYHITYANVAKVRSKFNEAINNSLKALSYFESINYSKGIIEGNTIIGHMYTLRGEFESSFPYYNLSIKKSEADNLPLYKINALIGKGNALYYLDSVDAAESLLKEAISLTEKFNPKDRKMTAGLYSNTGNIYLDKEDYIQAASYYKKGFNIYYEMNDKYGMSLTAYNLGDAFLGLNEYDSSKKYFNINLFLGQELQNLEEIKFAYKGFTNLYEQQGDFQSALESYYQYIAYSDSIRDEQYSAQLEALTQKYKEDEKLKLAEEKLAHSEEIREKQREVNIILGIGIVIVAIAILVVLILYNRSIKTRKLLLQTSKEIEEKNKKIDKALHQKETLLKEVHHRVKNNLQLIASLLNLQSATMENESAREAIDESKSRVQAIALMHKGLYQDDNYNSVDLQSYVSELVDNLKMLSNSTELSIKFDVKVNPIQLDIDKSVPIGLILSELISNSLKHAFNENHTGAIDISITELNQKLLLEYADNGSGLPENFKIEEQETLGFTVICALADQVEGELHLSSYAPLQLRLEFWLILSVPCFRIIFILAIRLFYALNHQSPSSWWKLLLFYYF